MLCSFFKYKKKKKDWININSNSSNVSSKLTDSCRNGKVSTDSKKCINNSGNIGLVEVFFLFNGISTFVDYLMAKPSLQKNNYWVEILIFSNSNASNISNSSECTNDNSNSS